MVSTHNNQHTIGMQTQNINTEKGGARSVKRRKKGVLGEKKGEIPPKGQKHSLGDQQNQQKWHLPPDENQGINTPK